MKTKKKPGTKARSAISGHYVKKTTAKRHPESTMLETVKPKKRRR